VLSERAAQRLFGTSDVIGRDLVFQNQQAEETPQTMTVVGLVSDRKPKLAGENYVGAAYLSLDQHDESGLTMIVRSTGDPAPLVSQLRRTIASVDPELAIREAGTGLAMAGPSTTFPRIVIGLASLLGSMALVLALAGLYGVLSHVVIGRTREIGVRLALGAGPLAIRRMVIVDGLKPVMIGLVAGLGFGMIGRAALQPVFLRIVPRVDLTLLVLVPALFIVAGLIACYLPARRASRVDPVVALRDLT
jgi:hypothetical protein